MKNFEADDYTLPYESVETLLDRQLVKKIEITDSVAISDQETDEEAVAASVILEEPVVEETPAEEIPTEEETIEEEPVIEEAVVEEPVVDQELMTNEIVTIEETTAEEIQNKELIEAESIHVHFLQKICQQFDADELNAHVKVVYKKKKEKKTSIFDIVMKKNRP